MVAYVEKTNQKTNLLKGGGGGSGITRQLYIRGG